MILWEGLHPSLFIFLLEGKNMNEKFRSVLRELNCAADRKYKSDDIPMTLLVVNDDNEPTDVNLIKQELNVCCLPANKTFAHLLYDVYRALSTHSTSLNSYQGEAEKFLEENYSEMPMGLRLVTSVNMARDAYAVNKSGYMGPIDIVLPLKKRTDISNTFMNDKLDDKQLKDMNEEILIRRKYMKKFMDALNKEKRVSKRKKPMSLKERNNLFNNFVSLAEMNGYDTSSKFEDKLKELPLEEQKKKVEESLLPLQFVCKRLHLPYTNKDTFETSCKKLIKVFDRAEPDYEAFVYAEKKKKEERIKDIDLIYIKMRPLVRNFLKPQYEKYSKEFSMITRGPLREMISKLMKDHFMRDSDISESEIQHTLDEIRGIR